jgi:hypothetical protein
MNVYEKLQTIRCELADMNLKKSGKAVTGKDDRGNKVFREYYELSDFMPQANKLMAKHKAATTLSFGTDLAVLTFINSEVPEERIEFTSPMSTAALGNCHPVQNLGAVETYIKRYLNTHCFDIMEFDPLEAASAPRSANTPEQAKSPAPAKETPAAKPEPAPDADAKLKEAYNKLMVYAQQKGYVLLENDKQPDVSRFAAVCDRLFEKKTISSLRPFAGNRILWSAKDMKAIALEMQAGYENDNPSVPF